MRPAASRKVVEFPRKKKKSKGWKKPPKRITWQGNDSIFFHRTQIRVGTELVCWGRLNHGQVWTVVRVTDYNGKARPSEQVERLSDVLHMKCEATQDERFLIFSGASYSAMWRLMRRSGQTQKDMDDAD